MRKQLLGATVVILALSMSVSAEQLDKVGPALNYWYSFYFDPDWIRHVEDSINGIQPGQTAEGLDVLPPPKMERGKPWVDLSQAPIKFIEGVPHVKSIISFTGNGDDLKASGVLISPQFGNGVARVSFPLSMLPEVLAHPTVQHIPDRAGVELLHRQVSHDDTSSSGHIAIHKGPGGGQDEEGNCN